MEGENNEAKKKSIMVWTESKDLSLLKAIAAEGIFINTKAGSRERGAAWLNVASALVAESLTVTSRSVRDRYNILARKWKAKVGAEEKESGGGDKHMSEVEILLEELVELESESEKVAEQQDEAKKAAAAKEKKQATEMRDRALERFGETRKRQNKSEKDDKDEVEKETKRRRSGGEALEWLKEKGESLRELKEKELQDRKEEREVQKMHHEQFITQLQATQAANNEQMKTFHQQMLQQTQQQQFTMLQHQMMAMMQQHTQLMSRLLKER